LRVSGIVPDYGAPNATYALLPGSTGYDYFGINATSGGLYVQFGAVLDYYVASILDLDVQVSTWCRVVWRPMGCQASCGAVNMLPACVCGQSIVDCWCLRPWIYRFGRPPFCGHALTLHPVCGHACRFFLCVQATSAVGLTAEERYVVNVQVVDRPPQLANTTYEVLNLNATVGYVFSPPLAATNRNGNPVAYSLDPQFLGQFNVTSDSGVLTIVGSDLNAR
jgi:hypothetical protein